MNKREIRFRAWVIAEKRMIYQPALLECSILEYNWASVCVGYKPGTDPDDYERKTIPCMHTLANIGYGLIILMQYTGLKDKNGLTEIYEGDIIDPDGNVRGNIYETPDKRATDFVVEGMGTGAWRVAEQKAMERGCRYAE